jgi:hypothetical protein
VTSSQKPETRRHLTPVRSQAIYTGKGIDPQQAYDLEVAKEIMREEKQS